MGIKKNLSTFAIAILSFSQAHAVEEMEVIESGKRTLVYTVDNQQMVFSNNNQAPEIMRTNLRNTRRIQPGERVSEIFSDGPQGSGRLRSLPGGVVVKFSEGVDPKAWAEQNNLTLDKALPNGLYLISTQAGRASLSKANQIAELDGVESVEPNWWTNVESKSAPKRVPASFQESLKSYFKR